jgi:UDP-perosamine 4-acetyltransferase
MRKIVIIGAGDGGRLVSQLVKEQEQFEVIGFIDDNEAVQGRSINGYKVIATSADLKRFEGMGFVVAVGMNMKSRSMLFEKAVDAGLKPINVVHRTAIIEKPAQVGNGAIVLANCVINSFAVLGRNVFIFTGTIIEHDANIGNNVYFSPGVSLAGHVKVGDNTFFGISSCTVEGVTIGSNVVVGAGSVVLRDIPDNTVVAGVPARILRRND